MDTTVGYLLGETQNDDLFRDPKMLQRFQDIVNLPESDKNCIITTMDYFTKSAKISMM